MRERKEREKERKREIEKEKKKEWKREIQNVSCFFPASRRLLL